MEIRTIKENEMQEALELVWKTYMEFEAKDDPEEGILEFKRSLNSEEWRNEREFYGAFENGKIVGVIATKNRNHIALFFVDEKYHNQGIGRKLYNKVLELNTDGFFTVNSSLYAHEIYKHLGFEYVSEMKQVNGLKFYPMKYVSKNILEDLVGAEKVNIFNKTVDEINSLYDMKMFLNNGGKKWDYEYKFRKGSKTLCAIYFKKNVLGFMIIFGKEEREKVEEIRNELSEKILNDYDNAATYHDGKWVMFELENNDYINDLKKLLYIKRKPNKK